MDFTSRRLLVGVMLSLLAATTAVAQLDDEVPHAAYYVAVEAFYAGEYRDAERELQRETRRGIRTTQARWIDSICYHAMLGEVLYHQGRNAEALTEFDQACQLLLAYPDWLLRVKFQQPPRPDPNRARRAPPWGRSDRQFTLGQLSQTEQVLLGDLGASRALQQGGVFATPMLWRMNVLEVVRTSALAIRRRNEILGPLAAHDPITRELSDMLGRGNLAPANHWSAAWIDLLRGLARAGTGKLNEAEALIGRALVIDGQFDYPLTCVVLLEQGRLAMLRGDNRQAAQLLAEAGFSAYYYENWDIVGESIWLGCLNHLASGAPGIYGPLESAAAWAQVNRWQHIAVKLRLAQAESLLWLGQSDAAAALIDDVGRRIGEMRGGLSNIHLLNLQAALQVVRGQLEPGFKTMRQALAAQAGASLRNFQIARTHEMYDSRAASPRVALDLYAALLSDPTPADWVYQPLDAMAVLSTSHDAAFDRWFIAALERKELPLALEIAERTKRRRFLAARPLGGRLPALRAILEAPDVELSRDGLLQRQQIFVAFPGYRTLADAGQKLYEQLRASAVRPGDAAETRSLSTVYTAWAKNVNQRQQLLAQLALRRLPSAIDFPPLHTTVELQEMLRHGEALAVFHSAGGNMYGFLLTAAGVHLWQLPDARQLRAGIGQLMQSVGNSGSNRPLSLAELEDNAWRKPAAALYKAMFAEARLDVAKTTTLLIVPDDVLWYLPFEALLSAPGQTEAVLGDQVPIRYGPTAALALPRPVPLRRPQHTALVANESIAGEPDAGHEELLQALEKVVAGPLRLPSSLPQPSHLVMPLLDGFVGFDDVSADAANGLSLLPRGRGPDAALQSMFGLPYGGPELVALTSFATEAGQGLKPPRRGSRSSAASTRAGSDVFQSLCGLMADGARTILLTRWRTGGRTNFELVREFLQELPHERPTEAWQRARLLAREAPLDIAREPRFKQAAPTAELPTADHPFFWAGYLLVDTSPRPESDEEPDDVTDDSATPTKPAAAPSAESSVPTEAPSTDSANEPTVERDD